MFVSGRVTTCETILELAQKEPPYTWEPLFSSSLVGLEHIQLILGQLGEYFPLLPNVFRAFDCTPLPSVKVVIFGQDPYHSRGKDGSPIANGLAFSVPRGNPVPPSLQNIYKELAREYPEFKIPNHGDLLSWSHQGVLLLNTCLTVKPHEAGSHKKLWDTFIARVIQHLNEQRPNCIYLLWGEKAQRFKTYLNEGNVLSSGHPSTLAMSARDPFIGNGHFKRCNDLLVARGMTPVNWQLPE